MSAEQERVNVTVSAETKRRVRVEAARRDMSMAELAREVLEEWVEEQGIDHAQPDQ